MAKSDKYMNCKRLMKMVSIVVIMMVVGVCAQNLAEVDKQLIHLMAQRKDSRHIAGWAKMGESYEINEMEQCFIKDGGNLKLYKERPGMDHQSSFRLKSVIWSRGVGHKTDHEYYKLKSKKGES
eukprot:2443185-Heterocapsa_arctica.AAC.1